MQQNNMSQCHVYWQSDIEKSRYTKKRLLKRSTSKISAPVSTFTSCKISFIIHDRALWNVYNYTDLFEKVLINGVDRVIQLDSETFFTDSN